MDASHAPAPMFLAAVPAAPDPEEPAPFDTADVEAVERWKITDLGGANWAMRKLQRAGAELARLEAEHRRQIDQANRWLAEASAPYRGTITYMTDRLETYGLAERKRTGQATAKLVGGKVATQRQAARIVIEDPDALITWCRTEAPDLVETKASVPVTKLRKAATMGEVVVCDACQVPTELTEDPNDVDAQVVWCPNCATIDPPRSTAVRVVLVHQGDDGQPVMSPPVPGAVIEDEYVTSSVRVDPIVAEQLG